MNLKKIVCTAILMAALSTLLVNQASAHQIIVFAAPNYPAIPWISGAFSTNGVANPPDADGRTVNDFAPVNPALPGHAVPWVSTGWVTCTWATQQGSVHGDTWIQYGITAPAGVKVQLIHEQMSIIPFTYRRWETWWGDAVPGIRTSTVDLGINPRDLSVFNSPGPQNPLQFQWTNGLMYRTTVRIWAIASPGGSVFIEQAKFDDVIWITYVTSPEKYSVQPLAGGAYTELIPRAGPAGTQVKVSGTGFAPETLVYIYFDDSLVNKTVSTLGGLFESWFNVPDPSAKGPHVVKAIDALENTAYDFFDVFIEAPPIRGDLNGDGRVNILDAIILAANFGKTDPNVDPPGEAGATDTSMSTSTLVLIAAVSIGLFRLRKRTKIDDKANTT